MVAFLLPPLEAVHSSFFVNPCVNAPKGSLLHYFSCGPIKAHPASGVSCNRVGTIYYTMGLLSSTYVNNKRVLLCYSGVYSKGSTAAPGWCGGDTLITPLQIWALLARFGRVSNHRHGYFKSASCLV